jgi:hypothetical protein
VPIFVGGFGLVICIKYTSNKVLFGQLVRNYIPVGLGERAASLSINLDSTIYLGGKG